MCYNEAEKNWEDEKYYLLTANNIFKDIDSIFIEKEITSDYFIIHFIISKINYETIFANEEVLFPIFMVSKLFGWTETW